MSNSTEEILLAPDSLARTAASIETRVMSIDGSLGEIQHEVGALRDDAAARGATLAELHGHLALVAHPVHQGIERQLRHIKLLLVLLCVMALWALVR